MSERDDQRQAVDILTLRLDSETQAHFDAMRQAYFPPERNHIRAHLTLFHALPREPWVENRLSQLAGTVKAFTMRVTGVRSLGRGVAYTLCAEEAGSLHAALAEEFGKDLIPQDRQRFQPHVVVQNKVSPEVARELLSTLERSFEPWAVRAEGLDLWHYLGGPWEHARGFRFAPASIVATAPEVGDTDDTLG